jgi:hypothetical protein
MENYWEGWGFTDRIPTTISATPRKLEILKIELKKSFPDSQIDELDSRNFRFYVKEEQLKKLKKFVATLNGKVYYEKGGNIGEVLATSNPYIGGAKAIQGIAPESVSAIDKKMASRINPDPNRPIFFNNGGKTPKEKNITNYKNAVESYINDRYKQDVDWSESMILFDDRSEETKIKKAVIVTKQGNEYEVYHDDIFSMFMSGGQVGSTDYSVAKIILEQLGGQGKLVVMTGANTFIAYSNGLSFKLKSRKANYVKITLNLMDLYDVQFQKLFGMKSKVVAEYDNLYFDQLIPIIEKETGMYLKLFKKGGFINTQNRDMVISQLKAIHHHEEEMLNTLKKSGEVEAWVLSKVSNASNDLSNVAHYLEFKE